MKTFKKIKKSFLVKEYIICDVCKKSFSYDSREIDELSEIQEFISINHKCGYGSVFGDGNKVKLDMCHNCFNNLLGKYIRIIKQKIMGNL